MEFKWKWLRTFCIAVYRELILFCTVYLTFNIIYRLALDSLSKERFAKLVVAVRTWNLLLPTLLLIIVHTLLSCWKMTQFLQNVPSLQTISDEIKRAMSELHESSSATSDIINQTRLTAMRYLFTAWILALRTADCELADRFTVSKKVNEIEGLETGVRSEISTLNADPRVNHNATFLLTSAEIDALVMYKIRHLSGQSEWRTPLRWTRRLLDSITRRNKLAHQDCLKAVDSFQSEIHQALTIYSTVALEHFYIVTTIAVYSWLLVETLAGQQVTLTYKTTEVFDGYIPLASITHVVTVIAWFRAVEHLRTLKNINLSKFLDVELETVFSERESEYPDFMLINSTHKSVIPSISEMINRHNPIGSTSQQYQQQQISDSYGFITNRQVLESSQILYHQPSYMDMTSPYVEQQVKEHERRSRHSSRHLPRRARSNIFYGETTDIPPEMYQQGVTNRIVTDSVSRV